MRLVLAAVTSALALIATSASSGSGSQKYSAERTAATVHGEAVVELKAPVVDPTQPQITGVQLLPGRGMNVFQIQGYLPGKGQVDLLTAQKLYPGENSLGDPKDDVNGSLSFLQGGAFLIPYANIVRGHTSPDGKWISTQVLGKTVKLPANYQGETSHEKASIHGQILDSKIHDVQLTTTDHSATAKGTLKAGDFGVGWPSSSDLNFEITLVRGTLHVSITAENSGSESVPIGIGWHPYFSILSGDRSQARVFIPAKNRVLTNNYGDVFPTGEMQPIHGTLYDFKQSGGKVLGSLYLDDCFVNLKARSAEVTDPKSHFGVRITAASPSISAFQIYSPSDKNFVALEPQYNVADPFNEKIRKKSDDTGMVVLQPGHSTSYEVQVQVFGL